MEIVSRDRGVYGDFIVEVEISTEVSDENALLLWRGRGGKKDHFFALSSK